MTHDPAGRNPADIERELEESKAANHRAFVAGAVWQIAQMMHATPFPSERAAAAEEAARKGWPYAESMMLMEARDEIARLRGLLSWSSGKLLDAGDHVAAQRVLDGRETDG